MRDVASALYHSLHPSGTPPLLPIPLPAPSTSRRADIPEADTPPRKRLLLTTPRPGCEIGESSAAAAARQPGPTMAHRVDHSHVDTMETRFRDIERRMMTALEMVNRRVSYQVDVCTRESSEFCTRHHDAQKDRAAMRAEIKGIRGTSYSIRERDNYDNESSDDDNDDDDVEKEEEDGEEEEHLAPADPFAVPTNDPAGITEFAATLPSSSPPPENVESLKDNIRETMTTVDQGMSVEEIERVVAQRVANAIEAIAIYETKTNMAHQIKKIEGRIVEPLKSKRHRCGSLQPVFPGTSIVCGQDVSEETGQN
ncbi:hypothetical protein Tco_0057926 [Tanacetum coccineum]